jgi:hypothetical protein
VLATAMEAGVHYTRTRRGDTLLQAMITSQSEPLYQQLLGQARWMVTKLLILEGDWLSHIYAGPQSAVTQGDPRDLVLYADTAKGHRREIGVWCKKHSHEIKSLRLGECNVDTLWFKHDAKQGVLGSTQPLRGLGRYCAVFIMSSYSVAKRMDDLTRSQKSEPKLVFLDQLSKPFVT